MLEQINIGFSEERQKQKGHFQTVYLPIDEQGFVAVSKKFWGPTKRGSEKIDHLLEYDLFIGNNVNQMS